MIVAPWKNGRARARLRYFQVRRGKIQERVRKVANNVTNILRTPEHVEMIIHVDENRGKKGRYFLWAVLNAADLER